MIDNNWECALLGEAKVAPEVDSSSEYEDDDRETVDMAYNRQSL